MLDVAVFHTLQVPLPPEPSRIVEERIQLSPVGQSAGKTAMRLASDYAAKAANWIDQINVVTADYKLVVPGPADIDDLARLNEVIDTFESMAEFRSKHRSRFTKRLGVRIKQAFELDASLGAVQRAFGHRLLATDDLVIEALLNYSLFLRAVRAERDPGRTPPNRDIAGLKRRIAA